jgi:hypothetical protein
MASVVRWKVEGAIVAHRDVFPPADLRVSDLWQLIANNKYDEIRDSRFTGMGQERL